MRWSVSGCLFVVSKLSLTHRLPRRPYIFSHCMLHHHPRSPYTTRYTRQGQLFPNLALITRSTIPRDIHRCCLRTVQRSSLDHPRDHGIPRTTTTQATKSSQRNAMYPTPSFPRYPHCRCQIFQRLVAKEQTLVSIRTNVFTSRDQLDGEAALVLARLRFGNQGGRDY